MFDIYLLRLGITTNVHMYTGKHVRLGHMYFVIKRYTNLHLLVLYVCQVTQARCELKMYSGTLYLISLAV